MSHPLEDTFRDAVGPSDLLFRSHAGVLLAQELANGYAVTRLFLPDDEHADTLREALDAFHDELIAVEHTALLWPEKPDDELDGLPALRYVLPGLPQTLAQFIRHASEGWTVKRLLEKLLPVASAINTLHKARRVHGAVAPVNVIVQRRKHGEISLHLFDCGVWKPVSETLLARRALGAGPAPRRRTPPNFASDVRSFGQTLRWLHAACADDASPITFEGWPRELIELTGRCARKRPIRASTVAKEFKRILETWDELELVEGPPEKEAPFLVFAGAFKSSVEDDAADPPPPIARPRRDDVELSVEMAALDLNTFVDSDSDDDDDDEEGASGDFDALFEEESDEDFASDLEDDDEDDAAEADTAADTASSATDVEDGWDLRTDDIEALIDFDPGDMPTSDPLASDVDEEPMDGAGDPNIADDPFGFSTSLRRATSKRVSSRLPGGGGERLLNAFGPKSSALIPNEVLSHLPKFIQASRITGFVHLTTGLGGGWGETSIVMHDDQLHAFSRATLFDPLVAVDLDPENPPFLEDDVLILYSLESGDRHEVDLDALEPGTRDDVLDLIDQVDSLLHWEAEDRAREDAFASGVGLLDEDPDDIATELDTPVVSAEGEAAPTAGPPGADGVLGRPEEEEVEEDEEDEAPPPPPTQKASKPRVMVTHDVPFPERKEVPEGPVSYQEHTLKPDVMAVDEEPEPAPSGALFAALVAAMIVVALIVIVFWSVVSSGAELPDEDDATGAVGVMPAEVLDADAVLTLSPDGERFAICSGRDLRVGSIGPDDSPRLLDHRALPDAACRALDFSPDSRTLHILAGDRDWWQLDLERATLRERILPFDGRVLDIVATREGLLIQVAIDERLSEWRVLLGEDAPAAVRLPGTRSEGTLQRCPSENVDVLVFRDTHRVSIVDVNRRQVVRSFELDGDILTCAVSPDTVWGAFLIAGSGVNTIRMATGERAAPPFPTWDDLAAGRMTVRLGYGEDGHHLLVAARDALHLTSPRFHGVLGSVRLESFESASDTARPQPFSRRALVFGEAGLRVVDLDEDVEPEARVASVPLEAEQLRPQALRFSSDGAHLIGVYSQPPKDPRLPVPPDGFLVFWELADGASAQHVVPFAARLKALTVSPDGEIAVAAVEAVGGEHALETFRVKTGESVAVARLSAAPRQLSWSNGGQQLLVQHRFGGSTVFAHREGVLEPVHTEGAESVVSLYRDNLLFVWTGSGLHAYDLLTKRRSALLLPSGRLGGARITSLSIHPFARGLVLSGPDGAFLFEVNRPEAPVRPLDTGGGPAAVSFSRDGQRFFTGHALFDASGKAIARLPEDALPEGAHAVHLSGDASAVVIEGEEEVVAYALPEGQAMRRWAQTGQASSALHPGLELVARSRRGVTAIEPLVESGDGIALAIASKESWAVASKTGFTGTDAGVSALLFGARGGEPALVSELGALKGASKVREVLGEGLGVEPLADPLASQTPLAFSHMIRLAVETQPAGAEVFRVNSTGSEVLLGVSPFEEEVEVGEGGVELLIRKPGFVERREQVRLEESVSVSVPLLDPITSAEAKLVRVEGPLSRDAVSAGVQAKRDVLRTCQSFGILFPVERLDVVFDVSALGAVTSVRYPDGETLTATCVGDIIESVRFPAAGGETTITYRFLLGQY